MRNRILFLSLTLGSLSACGADGTTSEATRPDYGDEDPPLANLQDLLADAPANRMLPDDNKADAVYPPLYTDLLATQSRVQSQGSRGVCSIFSTVGLMEHLYIKAGVPVPDFSEQYLQWSTKVELGAFPHTSGSSADVNLRAISQKGIVEEAAWPYESFPWSESNDAACAGEESAQPVRCFTNGEPPDSARSAQKFKLPAGKWINTNSIKAHLTTKKTSVIVGLDFFYQSWNHRKSVLPTNADSWAKGYVLAPNDKDVEESHKMRAGHSILIVGWDDNLSVPVVDAEGHQVNGADGRPVVEKGFWIFKNSWGTGRFGVRNPHGDGYGYLSMRYVSDYGSAYVSGVPTITPPPPPTGGQHFEAAPGTAIPDNDATGIKSSIDVTSTGPIGTLSVTVDITHPYVGDLTVRLTHGGRTATLQDRAGGADDDLKKTFTVADFRGAERAGSWQLEVVDSGRADLGTLTRWSLDLQ